MCMESEGQDIGIHAIEWLLKYDVRSTVNHLLFYYYRTRLRQAALDHADKEVQGNFWFKKHY